MAKDINKDEFPEETKLKLEIFAECFREWLPVFLYNQYIKKVFIYDFFAGSGLDSMGNLGSPLILLKEAKGENCKYCQSVVKNNKEVVFAFNEKVKSKSKYLKKNATIFLDSCKEKNCNTDCIYKLFFENLEFQEVFQKDNFKKVLNNKNFGKFILLDQYGFSQVDDQIFKELVNAPKTDFIFFISSSFIKRFKNHPSVKQYIKTENLDFDEKRPKECHRIIADYFERLIPERKEYYLHHYTIKKGSNYWGLIFGTNHTLGMEKFLSVCWEKDKLSGDSNCNIDNDYEAGSLFHDVNETYKKQKVKEEIKQAIISKQITDNISGLKMVLKKRCLPELFTVVIKELEKQGIVKRIGAVNNSSTNIHKIKEYQIKFEDK
ncbi:MAG: three-Cys-motif partner protein TcmP [Paludibacteraceae bacterium]|nr:three-Cys-motif partner protein TcmP [Paludibacteraceae bacterium]MBN2787337.1 three-Cys-motif partner protein TcmP [Paludibacteraceae bacterium]